jgi:hypothetical protein
LIARLSFQSARSLRVAEFSVGVNRQAVNQFAILFGERFTAAIS